MAGRAAWAFYREARPDRNISNIVGEPKRAGPRIMAELHAIDFEKSRILRGENMFAVGMMDAKSFWPREILGRLSRGRAFPAAFCTRISATNEGQIDGAFERLLWDFTGLDLPWRQSAVFQLVKRAAEIRERVQEVWNNG